MPRLERFLTALPLLLACPLMAQAPSAPADLALERAEWNARPRRDAQGRLLAEHRLKALAEACDMPVDPSMRPAPLPAGRAAPTAMATFGGRRWVALGPKPAQSIPASNQNWGAVAGRVSAVAIDPSNESAMLLASATGGLWKSADAGVTWRSVASDSPALAFSHVAYAPSNPSIVYAASGDVDNAGEPYPSRSFGAYYGAGLLRSNDSGETWARVDLELPANAVLSRVVVHPADPMTVLVGVYVVPDVASDGAQPGGIYRSTDGGVHFTRTFTHRVTDLVADPGDLRRVYLGAGVCSTCGPSGVYSSGDFGQTWSSALKSGDPVASFANPSGRIRLGASRSGGSTILYASVLDTNSSHAGGGIFRSADGGASWQRSTADPRMCPSTGAGQCFYNHWIAPAPGSATTVYFGAVGIYKSTDAGSTWTKIVDPYNATGTPVYVHPDQHMAVFAPSSPDTVYFCGDGGLYRTRDGGQTFENLNSTLTLGQFNGVALHPTNPELAIGGTQDNGNLRYTGSSLWSDRTGSDGGFNFIHPSSPWILSGLYFALMVFSPDGGDNYSRSFPCNSLMDCSTPNQTPLEPMGFYPPATTAPGAPSTVFLGAQRVWANPTFGADASKWKPRSPGPILSGGGSDVITALAVAGDGSGTIWAGSIFEGIFLSTDGGATFSSRNNGLPDNTLVTAIVAATADGQSAYATMGGYLGAPSRHVFRTADGGQTWTNISGSLPDVPVLSIAIDPSDPNDLFVGTDVGVFRSVDGGSTWLSFNEGMTNAAVYGLVFHPATRDLWAATYGRGVFRIAAPSVSPAADFSSASARIVAGAAALFVDTSANDPTSWAWNFGDPSSGAANTSVLKNPRHTYSAPGIYTVTLIASNAIGSSQVSHTITVLSGGPCPRCPRISPFR